MEIQTVPDLAQSVRQMLEIGIGNRGEVYQTPDPTKVIKEGDFQEIVAQSAAFALLRNETNFVIPDSTVLFDPAAPGRGFLLMGKMDFIKPQQVYQYGSQSTAELIDRASVVLDEARAVLDREFIPDIKRDDNWGIVDNSTTNRKLDKNNRLDASDIVIYDPVFFFAAKRN